MMQRRKFVRVFVRAHNSNCTEWQQQSDLRSYCSKCEDSTAKQTYGVGDFFALERKYLGKDAGDKGKIWFLVEGFCESAQDPQRPQVQQRPQVCHFPAHAQHVVMYGAAL